MTEDELQAFVKGYSKARLVSYLQLTNADPGGAFDMVEWEHNLASALWMDIARCELVVRNAIHHALQRLAGHEDWPNHLDALSIRGKDRTRVEEAFARIVDEGKTPTVDRIVANLTFTFWANLTSSAYDRALWSRGLDQTFQLQRRKTVHDAMTRVKDLRNAVAHHAPLVKDNKHETAIARITKDHQAIQNLRRWVNPTLSKMSKSSNVNELLAQFPVRIAPATTER